jgi:H+/Cl- antiporter ClcA
VLGGLVGGFVVVGVTLVLKLGMELVAGQATWVLLVVPLVGLALSGLVLEGLGRRDPRLPPRQTPPAGRGRAHAFRTFPPGAAPADITGDVIDSAGEEERFPWRLAPIRAVAVLATVGLGGPMGTEAPAAYFGVAAGAWLGDRRRPSWRRLLRPAALGGGAAGVSALMGIPLMGSAYMLELGYRHGAPLSVERIVAALIGGVIGWGIDVVFGLQLIRLIAPDVAPRGALQAVITVIFIGALSGGITGLAGAAIARAKKWKASIGVRLALGASAAGLAAAALVFLAVPSAAVGPGGGAILWAESHPEALPRTLLAVAVLRAIATTGAAAAGGCGGIFIPFLAVGDIAGRVFAPGLGIGQDLAGAAGAAAGIAGGYRLPFTATTMILGLGGPKTASLTCLVTVAVAYLAGSGVQAGLGKLGELAALRRSRVEPGSEPRSDRHPEAGAR